MFYDIFERLCHEKNTSPFSVAIELGFSRSTPSYWKRSGKPPKREHLEKIAAYFGVTVDYLLGREKLKIGMDFGTTYTENAPTVSGESVESLLFESRTADEWMKILNGLNRENKIKLFEYANLLLLAQDQADKAEP